MGRKKLYKTRLKSAWFQDTLYNRLAHKEPLTEEEIDALVALLGSRCHEKTVRRLRSVLTYPAGVGMYGIYNRVMLTPRMQYIAGQHYPSEIRTVRECLLGR